MHKPAWEADNEQFREIEPMLADRPYTMIAGHEHYYSYTRRFDRDYADLSTTGGIWITMTDEGPIFGNIRLDSLMDKYGPQ